MATQDGEIKTLQEGLAELKRDLAAAQQQSRSAGNDKDTPYIKTIRAAIAEDQARLDRLVSERDVKKRAEQDRIRQEKQQEKDRQREQARQDKIRQASARTDWFAGIDDKDTLKREYKRLAKEYHPDKGGSDEIMSRINGEYNAAMDRMNSSGQQQQQNQKQSHREQNSRSYTRQQTGSGGYEPEYETYEDYQEPRGRATSQNASNSALELERERTRRQKITQREQSKRQQERYRFERQRYRQYQRREARRAVQRAVAHGAHNAAVASKKQKYAQAQTGGLRVRPDDPRLIDKLPASSNPAYTAWGAIGTGGALLFGTQGPAVPIITTTVAGLLSFALEDADAREVAIGAAFGAGLLGLVRLLGKVGG